MLIGVHIGNGYGSQQAAWRMPAVDPQSYTSDTGITLETKKNIFLFAYYTASRITLGMILTGLLQVFIKL